jgi:hypothetical protein
MKRAWCITIVLLLSLPCVAWQFPSSSNRRASRITSRTLTGTVLDKSDQPVANAVVYLKNTKSLAVKTFIAQKDGSYRFPELSPNIDYDLYAEKGGKRSDGKVLSQFDDRPNPNINLRINMAK